MSEWLSAQEAKRRAVEVGLTGDDLVEWARLGWLRTRAKSRVDSDDVSPPNLWLECVIDHPEEPSADEAVRLALGPWPDVPAYFWAEQPTKANWGAGTFANKVYHFCDHHQELTYAYIELFDVTFHTGELGELLNGRRPRAVAAPPPKERWQQQRACEQQKAAFLFLETLQKHPPKDAPLSATARYKRYADWAKHNGFAPFGRTAFHKWAKRHVDGWRERNGKWVYDP